MRFRGAVLALALLAAPLAAKAQPFQGLYIGAGAGYNLPVDIGATTNLVMPSSSTTLHTGGGFVGLASIGYALGNGMRFEIEGNYRRGDINGASGTVVNGANGSTHTYGAMANALFDMDVGLPWLYPYIGGGVGYAWTNLNNVTYGAAPPPFAGSTNGTQGNFAFQAIGGLAFPIPGVPGLSLTAEYRFFGIPGHETFTGSPAGTSIRLSDQYNNSFLFGVRYAFNVAAPVATPVQAAVPAQAPARSYLVFFDWDKATLTDRAREIIKQAADNSTHVQYTRIEVNGYTDTSGTPQYNQGLSIRRAKAVQAELIKDGVPGNAITIQGFGETHLLVPTGPGVREPQNRRVEIIIR
jgi:outer membrane protein OmpA-like peptidoglycan-associated protein